ncbi:MAG: HK97 family phage prohead protease [Gemmatimonadales bacterium]|nr:HK97 family phage prohead protease [Gemmatimonadales bacterium]
MSLPVSRAAAAAARAQAGLQPAHRPSQRRMAPDATTVRASAAPATASVRAAADSGSALPENVFGIASRTEVGYEMWDMFGPYTEVVDREAFDGTLAAEPLVEFALNHSAGGGAPMAHTRNDTLTLSVTDEGLAYDAHVDTTRTDVSDMVKALQRGDLAEASFKFRIVRGQWSPDYSEYRILEVDLNRGDVSAVNFGANPTATSGARSLQQPALAPSRVRISDADVAIRTIPGL